MQSALEVYDRRKDSFTALCPCLIIRNKPEPVKQCGATYENCVASSPGMIQSCTAAMNSCIDQAQIALPQPADGVKQGNETISSP